MRCQCPGCDGVHYNPCKRTGPLNQLDGVVLCACCLNRRLEFHQRRLYPEIIPDVT